ncbi:MAG: site-specific integrase [Sedimentisphaerales bacterium]|nr:site-specific integrase [Sedimentisphaerales bacterium]
MYLIAQGLSENTVRRTCGIARQFFRAAVRRGLAASNPFTDLKTAVQGNKAREFFVSRQDIEKVLEACPDAQWRLIVALARYGGLRTPSETLALTWSDVDWEKGKMLVRSPKTEHHAGGESRFVPVFPELRPYLMQVFEAAEPGAVHCITRYRRRTLNLRTQFLRILAKAGVKRWPKLFQNLRATRETELVEHWPEHVVCAWLGNTRLVARKHYLQVTEEHFEQAAQNAAHLDAGAQNAAQYSAGRESIERGVTRQDDSENADLLCGTSAYKSLQDREMGDTGLEPVTSRV